MRSYRADPDTNHSILVVGIGNSLLTDDGAGPELLALLEREGPADPAVRYIDGGTLSFTLAPHVEAADCLLVLDAARFGGTPGATRCWHDEECDAYLGSGGRRSVHEICIRDVFDMARLSGHLPARRVLLGIEPESIDWGTMLSPTVAAALPQAAQLARGILHGWLPRKPAGDRAVGDAAAERQRKAASAPAIAQEQPA